MKFGVFIIVVLVIILAVGLAGLIAEYGQAAAGCARFQARAVLTAKGAYCVRIVDGTEYLAPLRELELRAGTPG